MTSYLGVDTGGTFTDFVCVDAAGVRIHKTLSTPAAPEQAILEGIHALGLSQNMADGKVVIVHGSTVATNAALEGKGVKTAYITNKGFADVLTLGRQARKDIYALQPAPSVQPVPTDLCFELNCRVDARGKVILPVDSSELTMLCKQLAQAKPEAVAINFLFSYLNPDHERQVAKALSGHFSASCFVSSSSTVLPEYKEYERGIATWLNAWLGPIVHRYLTRLQAGVGRAPLGVMQSSGGTIDAKQASERAVNLLLSGPAGGLAAVAAIAKTRANQKYLTFDMGGTSTDVALLDGDVKLTTESSIGPYPVAVPMVDMHTIGAGGGSIAFVDEAGMLHVGPASAGADPGPICYGRGGELPTVSDANAVLGRLRPEYFLGGRLNLNAEGARQALAHMAEPLNMNAEQLAQGILDLANEHIVAALRVISVQRGYDPADFELCCFGGAGGLQVCAVAEALGVTKVLLPKLGGVLSAQGMIVAPKQRQLSRTLSQPSQVSVDRINALADDLLTEGQQQLLAEGVPASAQWRMSISLDCRYQGQSFTLEVPYERSASYADAFVRLHQERYGYTLDLPVETVNVRVSVSVPSSLSAQAFYQALVSERPSGEAVAVDHIVLIGVGSTPVYDRASLQPGAVLHGPALICEKTTTSLVASGWTATVTSEAHLALCKASEQAE